MYIEDFLQKHADDVRGSVLEVKDDAYTRRYGGSRVQRAEVLDIDAGNRNATIVLDLNTADQLPSAAYDCVILTQTLHLIYEKESALANLHRALKPGGVLLVTVPGITKVPRGLEENWYWSFTRASLERLLDDQFGPGNTDVTSYGNVLVSIAFLEGLVSKELTPEEIAVQDPEYPVTIAARSVKPHR